jgi:two-component system, NarL family, sensor kinase
MKISIQVIYLAALLCCSLPVAAQRGKADSMLRLLPAQKDSFLTKTLVRLSEVYRNLNNDSSLLFAERALQKATEQQLPWFKAKAWNNIGYARYIQGNYDAAAHAFKNYYTEAVATGKKTEMAYALNNEGNVYIEQGLYSKALEKQKEALLLRQQANDTPGAAMSYNNIGFIYKDIGDYDKAISNFLFALREFEKLNDRPSSAYSLNYLAAVYAQKKDYAQSIASNRKALAMQQAAGDAGAQAISLHSIAEVFNESAQYDSAVYYFNQVLPLYEQVNDPRQTALVYAGLGDVYKGKLDFNRAVDYYKKSITLSQSIGNRRSTGGTYNKLAQAWLLLKNYGAAKAALDSSAAVNNLTGKKQDLVEQYRVGAGYYAAVGNYEKAAAWMQLYASGKDSLLSSEKEKAIADMQVKYDTEKKEQQLQLQELTISRKQLIIGKRNIQLGIAAGILLAGGLLGWMFYNRRKLKQEARLQQEIMRQQDMATRAVIEAEENERKRIAADLHDGVGQLMSAAKMNLSAWQSNVPITGEKDKLAFEKIMALVDESAKEIRGVSHNLMPNALLKASLAGAVREFIDKLDTRVLKVDLYAEGLNEKIDTNVETVLYRVIQECVNNVIKHSGASRLDISLVRENSEVSVTIEDNGRGFDTQNRQRFEGVGLKSIQSRVEYLKGTVEFSSTQGRGTLVAIHIPLPNQSN